MSIKKNIAASALVPKALSALWAGQRAAVLLGLALTTQVLAWEVPKDPAIVGSETRVAVGPGETLYEVARRHGYAMEHLAEANGLPVAMAPVGKGSVLIPGRRILPAAPPRPGVVVNLPERGFYVFGEGTPRFFPIAVGEPGRFATPTGSFSIVEKVENPDWVAPEWAGLGENNVVKAGPDNPLGDRWIGLSSPGLGMHSTNNPASIGSASSHGCMRMYPEVAHTVFDLVRTGWPVRIEYETTRVGLERSGIFVSSFPDIYGQGGRLSKLRRQFEREDLLGFFDPASCTPVLEATKGVPVEVVDLAPKAWLGTDWFPAARLGGVLYVEQGLLEKAGVVVEPSLAERSVRLTKADRSLAVPLYLSSERDRHADEAFLSRGSGWYPARKVLGGLGLSMVWEAAESRLRVTP